MDSGGIQRTPKTRGLTGKQVTIATAVCSSVFGCLLAAVAVWGWLEFSRGIDMTLGAVCYTLEREVGRLDKVDGTSYQARWRVDINLDGALWESKTALYSTNSGVATDNNTEAQLQLEQYNLLTNYNCCFNPKKVVDYPPSRSDWDMEQYSYFQCSKKLDPRSTDFLIGLISTVICLTMIVFAVGAVLASLARPKFNPPKPEADTSAPLFDPNADL